VPRSPLTAFALAAGALLLPAAAPGAAQAASKCQAVKPAGVKLAQSGAADRLTVTWRIPRRHPAKLAFRVARDGVVVGQTRGRSMSVAVRPGTPGRITVTAVVRGRTTSCRAVVHAGAGGTPLTGKGPGAVIGLAARPGTKKGRVALSWDPATAGTRALAGYRILRDGKRLRTAKQHAITVLPGKRAARFQVVAVDTAGRTGRLSRVVTIKTGYVPPSTPQGVAVSDISDAGVTLSWARSRGIGARIDGYRVIRDDRTVGSVNATKIGLAPVPAGRSQTYRLVAIDAHGWASMPSAPVTASVGVTPPSAPGAPTATALTDTSVSLAWGPAQLPMGSKLRGYRVMRDGVTVMQVPGEAATIGNLAPKAGYDWSVAAIDSAGNLSAPSPATRIVQADPPPTAGLAQAFLLASTDASFAAFRNHYRQIGVVYPTFFDCERTAGTGRVEGRNDPQIVTFAQDRKVKVLARFNCQQTEILHRILTEPELRSHWLDTITAYADQYGYDGVNIDFEAVAAEDRDPLTSFIADLSERLHAKGKLLSQAVSAKTKDVAKHPRSTAFDYAELAKFDDWVFVMAWGLHWSTSAPGPQDDVGWVRQVADYVTTMPNKEKFVMGTMLYGLDWPAGGGPDHEAAGWNYGELQAIIARTGATPVYEPAVGSWHLAYTDEAGVSHDAWYTDAPGVGDRIAMARDRGLGVGFWRLGQEDERMWSDPRLPMAG
jgi:spore germination protein YaaH